MPGDRPVLPYSQEVPRRPAAVAPRAVSLLAGVVAAVVVGATSLAGAAAGSASAAVATALPPLGAPVVLTPVAVEGSTAKAPAPAKVAAAVAPSLNSGAWTSVSAMVLDPADGRVLYDSRGSRSTTPASTLKIVTALSVLTALGPDTRLRTRTVLDGSRVVLVGGGDATLTRSSSTIAGAATASVDRLAEKTAAALRDQGVTSVSVGFDDSLFTGPSVSPEWNPALIDAGVVAPVSALSVDQGRESGDSDGRVSDPAESAARYFAARLAEEGIAVTGDVSRRLVPAGAPDLALVLSPELSDIVSYTLTESDNDVAEALARLAGDALGGAASFTGGAKAAQRVLKAYGVPTEGLSITDGSGLSRDDRIEPVTLVRAWEAIVTERVPEGLTVRGPVGWAVATGVPVAGFTGSLEERFSTDATEDAHGVVRAKTGTLTGVSSLSGFVRDRDGRLLVFAALATGVPDTDSARNALDRFAAAIAKCGCGSS